MSVTPDDPALLPLHVRPERLGGQGRLPVFEIKTEALGDKLAYRADPKAAERHGFVEPAASMSFDDYQAALEVTQPSWIEVSE